MEDPRPLVLVVDPESAGAAVTARILRDAAGFRVRAQGPPQPGEAIDLTDVNVLFIQHDPEHPDGLDLATAVRDTRPEVALLLCAETLDEELMSRALLAGFDEFMSSPVDPVDAVMKLGRVLQAAERRCAPEYAPHRREWLEKLLFASTELERRARAFQGDLALYRCQVPNDLGVTAAARASDAAQATAHAALRISRCSLERLRKGDETERSGVQPETTVEPARQLV